MTEEKEPDPVYSTGGVLRVAQFVVLEKYYDTYSICAFVRVAMKRAFLMGYNHMIMEFSELKHLVFVDYIVDEWHNDITRISVEDLWCRKLRYYSRDAAAELTKALNKK